MTSTLHTAFTTSEELEDYSESSQVKSVNLAHDYDDHDVDANYNNDDDDDDGNDDDDDDDDTDDALV